MITCTICGHTYDPAQHAGCSNCPVYDGCAMTCCPNCGANNVNPAHSKLAKLIIRLLGDKNAQSSVLAQRSND